MDMFTFIKTSGIFIPKDLATTNFYQSILQHLTRLEIDYQTSEKRFRHYYAETDTHIIIPRFFPLHEFINKDDFEIVDKSSVGKDIEIATPMILRPGQEDIIDYIVNNNSGIIQSGPGTGKTNMAIYSICQKKKKTFILVHKDGLEQQWADRFSSFTNLNLNQIARMESSNYIKDLEKPIIVCTVQMFISLLKSVNREHFLKSLQNAGIGIFIGDEVHTSVGAPIFSLCSLFVNAKHVIGLSATPYRFDKNEDIISYHLGDIYVPEKKIKTMPPKIKVLLFDFGVTNRSRKYIYCGGTKFDRSRYLNCLKNSALLTNLCVALLNKSYSEKRQAVMIAERIKFIDIIYDMTKNLPRVNFIQSMHISCLKAPFVYATPGKMRDGIDIPEKSVLIMTSPISNVEQAVGRVCREHPNKPDPVVFDIVDIGTRDISSTFYTRLKYYSDIAKEVEYYFVTKDGVLKPLDKEQAMEIIKIGT